MQNEVSSLIPVTESSPSPQYSCLADFLGMMLWAVQKLGVAKEKRGEIGCPFPERKEKKKKKRKDKESCCLSKERYLWRKRVEIPEIKVKLCWHETYIYQKYHSFSDFFFLLWIKRAKKEVSLPGFEGEWAAPLKDQIKLIKANELCEPGSCC